MEMNKGGALSDGVGAAGWRRARGENRANCNRIINKIINKSSQESWESGQKEL